MPRSFALLLTTAAALVVSAVIALRGLPLSLPDGPEGRVNCVSYAPYLRGQTPFDEDFRVPAHQIDRDMAHLAQVTHCVRTYSTGQGLDAVPAIAARHGLESYVGAWIGATEDDNQAELARLVAVARDHADSIRGLIIGNEVLLRGEQSAATLARYIAQVRTALRGVERPPPLTYADVWEFWERHPDLTRSVDLVTIHILPYWEDDPVPVDQAVAHVETIWRDTVARVAPKPVLIGETGWPSAGRRRQGAEPSLVNQTRFVRGVLARSHDTGMTVNLIEAFDQPWKRDLEGTVGGAWGLFDADRDQKVPLTGPVIERPGALVWLTGGLMLGLGPLGFALMRGDARAPLTLGLLTSGGLLVGATLVLQSWHALEASRTVGEWAVNLGWLALSAGIGAAGVRRLAGLPGRFRAGDLAFVAVLGMTVASLALLFDPRYRDMPVSLFLAPAVLFALMPQERPTPDRCWVAGVLGVSALGILVIEGPMNTHAWAWAATALGLALPVARARLTPPPETAVPPAG